MLPLYIQTATVHFFESIHIEGGFYHGNYAGKTVRGTDLLRSGSQ